MRRTIWTLVVPSSLLLVALGAGCRRKPPPAPTPVVLADPVAAPSASSSMSPPKPPKPKSDHCALVDPHGVLLRDHAMTLPSVVAAPGGAMHASAVIDGEGAIELDLDATGVVTPKPIHAGELQSTGASFAIDGGPGRFVLFGRPRKSVDATPGGDTDIVLALETPKRTLERSTWNVDQYHTGVYLTSRVAVATDGGARFLAVTLGREAECPVMCQVSWSTRVCTCPVLGLPRDSPGAHTTDATMEGIDDARLWSIDAEKNALVSTDGIDFPGMEHIDAIAMAGDEKAAYLVYKKEGGIYVSPIAWDDPKSAARGKAVAGGDLGAPSVAIAGDTVWLAWPQRPTPGKKDPRTLYAVGYRRAEGAEGKAGMPKRLLPELGGTTIAPTLIRDARDGDGVALAWMQLEGKRTKLYLGRGATPELAAQAAVVLDDFDGEGHELAFALSGKTGAILWSKTADKAFHASTYATRIECP